MNKVKLIIFTLIFGSLNLWGMNQDKFFVSSDNKFKALIKDDEVEVYNFKDRVLNTLKHESKVNYIEFFKGSKFLITKDNDYIYAWNPRTANLIHKVSKNKEQN